MYNCRSHCSSMPTSLLTRIPWHFIVICTVLCMSVYIVLTMSDLHRLLDLRIESLRNEFLSVQQHKNMPSYKDCPNAHVNVNASNIQVGNMDTIKEVLGEEDTLVTSMITHYVDYDDDIEENENYEEYYDEIDESLSSSLSSLPKAEVTVLNENDEESIKEESIKEESIKEESIKEESIKEESIKEDSANESNLTDLESNGDIDDWMVADEKTLKGMKVDRLRRILKTEGVEFNGLKDTLLKKIMLLRKKHTEHTPQ
jgi:hypothetical protein